MQILKAISNWKNKKRQGNRSTNASNRATRKQPRHASIEQLENRWVHSVSIDFQWEGDFFNTQQKRDVLEDAAYQITNRMNTSLAAIPRPAGGEHKWTAYYDEPSTGVTRRVQDPVIPEDTLVVYVGGRSMGDRKTGETCEQFTGPPTCGVFANDNAWRDLLEHRGNEGRFSWGGSIAFNSDLDWHFGSASSKPNAKHDFYTAALHEVGRLIGFTYANPSASSLVRSNRFHGANAASEYGSNVPVDSVRNAGLNWASNVQSNGLVPSMRVDVGNASFRGVQRQFTELDFAALEDIGWDVSPLGDANRDGFFTSADFITVFVQAEYEDNVRRNSTWEDGDWNGDREFNSADIVYVFQHGTYSQSAVDVDRNEIAIKRTRVGGSSIDAAIEADWFDKTEQTLRANL